MHSPRSTAGYSPRQFSSTVLDIVVHRSSFLLFFYIVKPSFGAESTSTLRSPHLGILLVDSLQYSHIVRSVPFQRQASLYYVSHFCSSPYNNIMILFQSVSIFFQSFFQHRYVCYFKFICSFLNQCKYKTALCMNTSIKNVSQESQWNI